MKTISQRELRNDNAEVIRGVEQGETYTVTRHGVPVALLIPFSGEPDLRCDRPARKRPRYTELQRVRARDSSDEILTNLRGDR